MWYSQSFAVFTGILGILILAVLLPILSFLYNSYKETGKWGKIIVNVPKYSVFVGIIIFVVGLVSAIVKQPFHVWYPLIMSGIVVMIIMGFQYLYVLKFILHSTLHSQSSNEDSKKVHGLLDIKKGKDSSINLEK